MRQHRPAAASAVLVLAAVVAHSAGAAVDQGSSSSGLAGKLLTVSEQAARKLFKNP
jgi:hypothetical protein